MVTTAVPWTSPGSGSTRNFDMTVVWMAEHLNNVRILGYWPKCVSRFNLEALRL